MAAFAGAQASPGRFHTFTEMKKDEISNTIGITEKRNFEILNSKSDQSNKKL